MTETSPRRPIGLAPGAPEAAAGQDAKKYATKNPVVLRLLDRWATSLRAVVLQRPLDGLTIVDVGVGEGLALERVLGTNVAVIGLEYRHDKLQIATTRLPAVAGVVGDAGMLPFPDRSADLVTSIEVLEHLTEPAAAVDEFARVCRPDGRAVVSVPWEPWFRLGNLGRGKNLGRLGNDPEHVQQFSPDRLRSLLEVRFHTVVVTRAFPWLIASAAGPRP